MSDHITRALLSGGDVRVVAVIVSEAAGEAARRHGLVAGSAVAVARASAASLLLATLTKDEERLTLQMGGDGPLGGVVADATGSGRVRAFVRNAGVPAGGGPGGRVSLGRAIGTQGHVSVVRDVGLGELFTGQTALVSGEIDEDVEGYLTSSEQIDSALGCDAVLDEALDVGSAGGVLVQALPGGEGAALVAELRARMRAGAVYDALAGGGMVARDAASLARAVLGLPGPGLDILDRRPVTFHCGCTRERVKDMLALLGPVEIDTILREQGQADISCNFCAESYQFDRPTLEEIRDGARPVQAS